MVFLHLTFQEYFAAAHAQENGGGAGLACRFGDPWWREVILLFSGLASPTAIEEFTACLLQTDALEHFPDLFSQCLDAAPTFPMAPLIEHLGRVREIGVLRLRGLLRLVRGQGGARLQDLCAGMLDYEDGGVVGLAKEILTNTGTPRRGADAGPCGAPRPGLADLYFVSIPGGEVTIGSATGHANERPIRVVLAPFSLSRYPVTNGQYQRFLAANPGVPLPRYWTDAGLNSAEQPVVGVSWDEAVMYCNGWGRACPRNMSGRRRAGRARAASSGRATARRLCGRSGGMWGTRAGACTRSVNCRRIRSVCMICTERMGMVRGLYSHEMGGPTLAKERVVRGGYWHVDANRARSSYRGRLPPGTRGFDLGFRVAR
jgi:hypothetical protein